MLEIYHPIDKTKTRETRLERLHTEICEQKSKADEVLSFLKDFRYDLGMPHNFLRAEMLLSGMLPTASKLPEFFSFDDDVYKKPLSHLVSLIEKMPIEEIAEKWRKFISEAEACLVNSPKTEKVDVAGWLIGPAINPFGAEINFLSPTKRDGEWPYCSEVPPIKYIAAWLTIEHGLKNQAANSDQWLGSGNIEVSKDDAVDEIQVERIFGSRGAARLFDLLPLSLRKAVNRIHLIDSFDDEEVTASDETTEVHGDTELATVLNLEDEEEATKANVEKVSAIKLIGQLDKATRTMILAVNETLSADEIINTWFHELGHAMIAGNSLIDQAVRRWFLKAVVLSKALPQGYVGNSYESIGIARGLEEDFAETVRNYCLFPREFQQSEPERFASIKEILAEHFPDFDLTVVQRKVNGFLKDADASEKKSKFLPKN